MSTPGAISHVDDADDEQFVGNIERAAGESAPSVVRCPRCDQLVHWNLREPAFGVGHCSCGEIPLAAGLVLAGADAVAAAVLDAVRTGQLRRARTIVLGKFARRVRLIESLGLRLTFRRFIRHSLLGHAVERWPVSALLERLPVRALRDKLTAAGEFNVYVHHRLCTPGILGMVALLGLLGERDGLVLDAPCGFGHLSFLISRLIDPRRIVCMDLSPAHAYAARRFFVPRVRAAIAADLCRPLPLARGAFAMIFCVDGFQYLHDKPQAVRGLTRLLRDDGVLVIGHSPNPAYPRAYLGQGLTPAQHYELFEGLHVRMFPGGYLPAQYFDGESIDLTRRFTELELNAAPMWDVIVAKSAAAFRPVPNVSRRMIDAAANPQLNEMYRMSRQGGRVMLHRQMPRLLADECRRFPQILPPRVELPGDWVGSGRGRVHFTSASELLQQYVLLDVPPDY
jgi:SAM-dependent methyltransferase